MPYSFNKKAFSPAGMVSCPGASGVFGSSFPLGTKQGSRSSALNTSTPMLFRPTVLPSPERVHPCHPERSGIFLCPPCLEKKILRRCAPQDDKKGKCSSGWEAEVFPQNDAKEKGEVFLKEDAGEAATRRPKLVFPVFPATRYGIARKKWEKTAFFH